MDGIKEQLAMFGWAGDVYICDECGGVDPERSDPALVYYVESYECECE